MVKDLDIDEWGKAIATSKLGVPIAPPETSRSTCSPNEAFRSERESHVWYANCDGKQLRAWHDPLYSSSRHVGKGSRLCEKSKALDCDRMSCYSFKTTLGVHMLFGVQF
jgi:hypothetical protein